MRFRSAAMLSLFVLTGFPATAPARETIDICARSPAIKNELMKATRSETCGSVALASLAGLTKLRITSQLGKLRPGDFRNLAALRALDLYGTGLEAIPDRIFSEVPQLESLAPRG